MAPAASHLALALLGVSFSVVQGNPIAASSAGPPKPSGSCTSWKFCQARMTRDFSTGYSSYCSSLQTKTTTTTILGTTVTNTLPVSSVTGVPSTLYTDTTTVTTITVCGSASPSTSSPSSSTSSPSTSSPSPSTSSPSTSSPSPSTSTLPANSVNKRASKPTRSPVPSELKNCIQTNIPKACSCLGFTATTVTSTSILADSTIIATPTPDTVTLNPDTSVVTSITSTSVSTSTVTQNPTTVMNVLTSPTPLTGVDPITGLATSYYDDERFNITLPFQVSAYGVTTNLIETTINGYIALNPNGYGTYSNRALPSTYMPDVDYLAYWADLYIYRGYKHGVWYQTSGEPGSRKLAIEWIVYDGYTPRNAPGSLYHFVATLPEAPADGSATTATYDFYEFQPYSNPYRLGTIGLQKYSTNNFTQYSFNQTVTPGTSLKYDPDTNSFVATSFLFCPTLVNVAPPTTGVSLLAASQNINPAARKPHDP